MPALIFSNANDNNFKDYLQTNHASRLMDYQVWLGSDIRTMSNGTGGTGEVINGETTIAVPAASSAHIVAIMLLGDVEVGAYNATSTA